MKLNKSKKFISDELNIHASRVYRQNKRNWFKKSNNNLLLPYEDYVHTITIHNGAEFAEHIAIAKKLETTIYFALPYFSWEKGQ